MGQEFAQLTMAARKACPGSLLDDPRHRGVQLLVGDLTTATAAAGSIASEALVDHRAMLTTPSSPQLRRGQRPDGAGGACNFHARAAATGWACPKARWEWREVLNTDSRHYGSSDVGNGATRDVQGAVPMAGANPSRRYLAAPGRSSHPRLDAHGRAHSLQLGWRSPLARSCADGGVNFACCPRHATAIRGFACSMLEQPPRDWPPSSTWPGRRRLPRASCAGR